MALRAFNTLTRRFFKTQGVAADVEFVALDIEPTDRITHPVARHNYVVADGVALVTLSAGEFFGEVALLAGGPRTASVDALTDDTPAPAQLSAGDDRARLRAAWPAWWRTR